MESTEDDGHKSHFNTDRQAHYNSRPFENRAEIFKRRNFKQDYTGITSLMKAICFIIQKRFNVEYFAAFLLE